jgi:hypothetical protein
MFTSERGRFRFRCRRFASAEVSVAALPFDPANSRASQSEGVYSPHESRSRIASAAHSGREGVAVIRLFKRFVMATALVVAMGAQAQAPNETATPIPTPSIPAGPRPTATVTPLQETPQPTTTVTPLPSASPAGTQPQTTNTVAFSPSP